MSYTRAIVASLFLIPATAALAIQAEKPAAGSADHGLKPHVKIDTNRGDIVLELDGEKAPISTDNFIQYAEAGFYKNTTFHRVMAEFMIQGGGYTPDYTQKKDGLRPPIFNEWKNGLKNARGTISMARLGGQADSATSQFFINVVNNTGLDQPRDGAGYAVFGSVVEGLDVVDLIRTTSVAANPKLAGQGPTVPVETVIIEDVTIVGTFDREGLKKKLTEAQAAATVEQEKARAEKAKADAERAKAAEAAKEGSKQLVADQLKKAEAETGQKGTTTPSGLAYVDIKVGEGAAPGPTDVAEVHYKGWFPDGEQFDSSAGKDPYPVNMARPNVITGWVEALTTMKQGGKRRVIIPPHLAYGPSGRPGIPPNAVLLFDMELVSVKKAGKDE